MNALTWSSTNMARKKELPLRDVLALLGNNDILSWITLVILHGKPGERLFALESDLATSLP